ncbi:polyketide synthase [Mycobacterium sp. 852002-51152_SCH6134967]|uniref:type I polyketide synthase n=1 Tax=Mycobacterium sp. 852002-51152_SCH6134967 TaxID=1834096 RepID=UPI00080058A3|nr:type I polyketide synthase [Mycobacterium sp. 852002-51152_SCH6134967]OBF93747.1 polyketide synthase [Mycobacterium sp. 852002-51152_SCH6134967]
MKTHDVLDRPAPLAIVGIGCRLPGGVTTAEDYWRLLTEGVDATREVPESRWNAGRFHDANPKKVGKMVTRRGGFLDDIDQFDPQFFGISPREAHSIDPQQRLMLQTTWEALEDGGIRPDHLAGTDVGVFIGGFTLDYQLLQNQGRGSRYQFKTHSAAGMMMTMLANRISFAFDFRGPSMTIDTACSSSLVAVHLAAQSIWNGESDLALAGGVNIMIGPNTAIAESKSGFLSPDGRCKAFDESADGYARGEGGAVVVIKPLEQALRDGDEIYAQILGTAVSQDGRTDGITVPRAQAQAAAITSALRRAGVRATDVGYVEAHGTGTPVGDPVEMRALAATLTSDRTDPLLIGSVKTNIGHLEAGAGVAGLIKTALVLKHGYIPAHLHLQNPTSQVSLTELKLDVPRAGRPFPAGRRIAGVNSFGFGGTNAHAVLAEPPTPTDTPASSIAEHLPVTLLPISARSEEALVATARQLADHLDAEPNIDISDLRFTLSQRRSHLSHRHTLVSDDVSDAREQLRALADGGQVASARTSSTAPKLVFVCTGMGPQWWRMCRGLLDVLPAFTESIARSDRELARHTDWSLIEELRRDEADSRMGETEFAQPANFAIQIALAAQLGQFGIRPDAVIGHSAGEVAAHHLAGLLTFEQAIEVIYHRSRFQQRTSGQGRMLAVGLDTDSLMAALDDGMRDEVGRRISVAAVNSPSAVTIAGDGEVLDDIARRLDETGVFTRYLTGKVPYHTHYMDAIKNDLQDALHGLSSQPATLPLYSTVTGDLLKEYRSGAAYWWQNTRATVLFEPAVRRMLDDGYTHFVELGPHPVLASSIFEIAGAQKTLVQATQRRNDDDVRTFMTGLGALHDHGHDIDWEAMYPRGDARLLKLPRYPWQTRRYWNETQEATESLHYHPVHPLLGQPVSAVHPTWEIELSTALVPFLDDHRVQGSVVVPGAVYIELSLAAAKETYGVDLAVEDLVLHRAVILDDTCDPLLRTTLNQDTGALEFAAHTATPDGELKWTITATAELTRLPKSACAPPPMAETVPANALSGDEFYALTEAIGFDYGAAFRAVTALTAGDGWVVAEMEIPAPIAAELDDYRFHPALIDGAFQTLFGAPLPGGSAAEGPYLPTRIRRSTVYGTPKGDMTVRLAVRSATAEEIESDITICDHRGERLALFEGFAVRSLSASTRMSPERIDKGLYELQWVPAADPSGEDGTEPAPTSWLVFVDETGFGSALADGLRHGGHGVRTVVHRPVDSVTAVDGGYAIDERRPEHVAQLFDQHLAKDSELTGVIDCWSMDLDADSQASDGNSANHLGVLTLLRIAKALAAHDSVRPRIYVITANAQPALGTEPLAVDQSTVWGLGRVVGHQEFVERWGGLIDIDDTDDVGDTAARVCRHILDPTSEDQVAFRGEVTLVPRLRHSASLTKPFPTKFSPTATYVVTGGTGALGRTVATYLAEHGARHITLLSRSGLPPRDRWPNITPDDPQFTAVDTVRAVERLGAQVSAASVDITDADAVAAWLAGHGRTGDRPIRGVIHAAGAVHDQLLVNVSEDDFLKVLGPKVTGTRALHTAFADEELDFFVMFGSAGSVIASPGQGNYAAANAFLDAFAHQRQAQGLPALTVAWGPWSVGMVEDLNLENVYAMRGIELITPATGALILDRLINQTAPNVIAISADWNRARQLLGGHLPKMFADLDAATASPTEAGADGSLLDALSKTPEAERLNVITDQVERLVAAVFDCAVTDFANDDMLDDIGLDSMMAMDFRVRINTTFSIDLPVLEILKGVSVDSLAARVLDELQTIHGEAPAAEAVPPTEPAMDEDVDQLIDEMSEADLRELLAELEGDAAP